ncbi:MAG TPA: hypothetical protein DEO83_03850 [Lachnospiraceae bacterium]|nr:hypothetical protein [Lachnospiraceae bacterium]
MLRYDDLNDISDGKLYTEDDMVCAGTNGCNGCSKCCESDMGNTIVLTPYDMYELTVATGKSFDELLTGFIIELSMMDGIVLPNLKMSEGCAFLESGRCEVHAHRPGICRLFPLGRIYNVETDQTVKKDRASAAFRYFLQVNECPVKNKTEVKVRDWLGIEDLEKNTSFINKWHRFTDFEKRKVNTIREMTDNEVKRLENISEKDLEVYAGILGETDLYEIKGYKDYKEEKIASEKQTSEEKIKKVLKTVIAYFYLDKYDIERDFYQQFDIRLKKCLAAIR